MVIGALVADAAAMGLHWIYDQEHIQNIAPQTPEFRQPDAADYAGKPGYFAHEGKNAGDLSQYGEQCLLMLRALVACDGKFEPAIFADHFRAHFGYGGAYCGYIDHATRDTLDNFRRFEDAVQARVSGLAYDGDAKRDKQIASKAIALAYRHSGAELSAAFDKDVLRAIDHAALAAHAKEILKVVQELPRMTGAHDIQLPATAKLPALVASLAIQRITEGDLFDAPVADAVRVTNDHPLAERFSTASAHMMAGAVRDGTLTGAIAAARAVAAPDVADLLDEALALEDRNSVVATKHFGMACDLPFGVPSAVHIIANSTSFTDATRQNIYAGGDTCGRAILVGAVAGAVFGMGGAHGIPQDWVERLSTRSEVADLLESLLG
jgi:ADP-ribosylglycohydrolase